MRRRDVLVLLSAAVTRTAISAGAASLLGACNGRAGTTSGAVTAGPPAGWEDVTSFGAVGDGVTDDTAAFVAAAASGKNLRVPRTAAHYKLTGTVRLSASVAGDGSAPEIRMHGADGRETHAMFEVRDYAGPGLVITGLHLNGQWDGSGEAGEWSHLVMIKGSTNVTVENNLLERPYGDCVLVGGEGNPRPSENVVIRDNRMVGPRRCNVAVISGRNVSIEHNVLRKRSGYVAAIDLEPNPNALDVVRGVNIASNDFDVAGVAIMLFSRPVNQPSGGVTITGNTAGAGRFFAKPAGTGPWDHVTLTGNTYRGGGSSTGRSFASIAQASDVTVDGNVIAAAGGGGGDAFVDVRALSLVNNVWSGDPSYPLTIARCPDALVDGNTLPAAGTQVRP